MYRINKEEISHYAAWRTSLRLFVRCLLLGRSHNGISTWKNSFTVNWFKVTFILYPWVHEFILIGFFCCFQFIPFIFNLYLFFFYFLFLWRCLNNIHCHWNRWCFLLSVILISFYLRIVLNIFFIHFILIIHLFLFLGGFFAFNLNLFRILWGLNIFIVVLNFINLCFLVCLCRLFILILMFFIFLLNLAHNLVLICTSLNLRTLHRNDLRSRRWLQNVWITDSI